jgi:hypothetical protein
MGGWRCIVDLFLKILLTSLATIVCCITIHEAGHAMASWFTGGRGS